MKVVANLIQGVQLHPKMLLITANIIPAAAEAINKGSRVLGLIVNGRFISCPGHL
jgi:hypothetical protein